MLVRIMAMQPVAPGGPIAWRGETAAGERICGLSPGAPAPEAAIPEAEVLPLPISAGDDSIFDILAHWPAFRMTEVAGLGPGSGALVLGEGWLAEAVLRHCRLRGCLWRAACPPPGREGLAEHVFSRTAEDGRESLRLPRPPDAAFVVSGGLSAIHTALSEVNDRGTVVIAAGPIDPIEIDLYADVHRRGLRVVTMSPLAFSELERGHWLQHAALLQALMRAGRLLSE